MQANICTYFDSAFYGRGLAMIKSLLKNTSEKKIKIVVLALDNKVEKKLNNLNIDDLIVVNLSDFLSKNTKLNKKKFNNPKEFFFSLTPSICLYCLKNFNFDSILYVDADIYFFNEIRILYKEVEDFSIGICSHRLPFFMKPFSNKYGIYNVGINYFKNDDIALKCLNEWNDSCLNWTPDYPNWKLPFFSDQVWLDDWPSKFKKLKIINHIGINAAPWNAINYKFSKKNDSYYVNNKLLVAYHFSNLGKIENNLWDANVGKLFINIKGTLLEIYEGYINQIDSYESIYLRSVKSDRNILKKIIFSSFKFLFNNEVKLKS